MMDALFSSPGLGLLEKTRSAGLNQDVGATPFDVIDNLGNMRLLRYSNLRESGLMPLLIVPSLINRFYILDLLPEKSLIAFLSKYFSVYVIDWGEAQDEEKELSMENLLDLHFDYFFANTLKDSKSQKAHLIGHCLGGNLSLLWSLIRPQSVASLSLMTTPLDFDVKNKLQAWARCQELDVSLMAKAHGHIPWLFLQSAFLGLKPSQIFQKFRKLLPKINDPKVMRSFLALESWSSDNRSLRGGFYQDLIELFYRQNCLFRQGFSFKGQKHFLKDLKLPVLSLSALDDHIVASESTLKKEWVPLSPEIQTWSCQGGHIGGLLGYHSQKKVWPEFVSWLQSQEEKYAHSKAAI